MAEINIRINGKDVRLETDPGMRLLDVIRDDLGLTGPKEGCGEGECGACAVLIDGRVVNSCLVPIGNVIGHEIVTIEGFRETRRYEVLKEAMAFEGGSQCGICTPGMMIAAESLLRTNPHPTEEDVRIGLSGNLCRCTGYNMIVKAVLRAAKKGKGLW
ncbi:MAG: (2Fe-2S)-binding protein [Acholeplasmataceae bacterium]|nr:(2Fe-2S)-binding protein [Acholeplasmataceae bacterium]